MSETFQQQVFTTRKRDSNFQLKAKRIFGLKQKFVSYFDGLRLISWLDKVQDSHDRATSSDIDYGPRFYFGWRFEGFLEGIDVDSFVCLDWLLSALYFKKEGAKFGCIEFPPFINMINFNEKGEFEKS